MGVRAAPAIEGRLGRMGGLGRMGRLGGLGQVGRVGQVRQVGVRAAPAIEGRLGGVDVYTSVMGCLSFAYRSLIVRSSCIVPISFVKGKWGEKKNLLIGKFAN